jgi:hypothetical protein
MAIKDNPGIMTMPRNERDWTKFIRELEPSLVTENASSSQPSMSIDDMEELILFIGDT